MYVFNCSASEPNRKIGSEYDLEAIAREVINELVEEGYVDAGISESALQGVEEVLKEHIR